jgi:ribonucleoside-diphosphate reductase alpha chain
MDPQHLLNGSKIRVALKAACTNLDECTPDTLVEEVSRSLYNNMTEDEIDKACILAARSQIEKEPEYNAVAARLLLNVICKEVFDEKRSALTYEKLCRENFHSAIKKGIENELIDVSMLSYDFDKLSRALVPERDHLFLYMGLQTIYDRYLLHIRKKRIEVPQYFWMRVAMGLAMNEPEKNERAIEFYEVLSTFRFISSTPTLFNAGTLHPQLSSCYLSTIDDDLEHIFKVIQDNALLSKWAGGIGNDWTNIRATGARIKGTNGESQGVVPFLKVANDTAIAVNQGGKRKGAICAYLETWHLEIDEFLELRKKIQEMREGAPMICILQTGYQIFL